MQVLISRTFIKNVPHEKENIIKSKIYKFVKELKEKNYNIKNISNGFSVWKVKGNNNIYKFRVDSANRVLFTFTSKIEWHKDDYEDDDNILILDYCNHDEQIHRSKNLDVNVGYINLENTNYSKEDQEFFNDEIDIKYANYYYDCNSDSIDIYSIDELEKIFGLENKETIKKLNTVQSEILRTKTPLFLFGSAGSGKTTVGIRKIRNLYDYNNINIGYFTYSTLLKNETEKMFNYLGKKSLNYTNNSTIKFYDMNGYLEKTTEIDRVVKYKGFKKWIYDKNILLHLQVSSDIDIFEIYREIRGIIKGMIGIDWGINESNLYNKKLLDKNTYLNLPSKFSTFSNRELAYNIALKYQSWLDENNLVDDNDLTVNTLKKLENQNIEKYDFLVVDEIQDLTEKQIYLLYKLVKNPKNVFFSGDYNQTVNATYFNTHRIKSLFKLHSEDIKFEDRKLTLNYRCDKEIVKLANRVNQLRADKLYKDKNDYDETYVGFDNELNNINLENEEVCKPRLLNTNNINKKQLLKVADDRHYVAIVVSDEYEKSKLKNELNIEDNVFTVSEIKGIEKPYIVCYNVVSRYKEQWKKILNKIDHENEHLYRYYFNMFYVAITRARKNICFYEDEICDLYSELDDFIEYIDEFNEDKLNLNIISTDDDYFITGMEYESKEKYEHAINQYKKSKKDGITVYIKRCEALILNEEGDYLKAGDIFFNIGEYELAMKSYKACKSTEGVIKSMLILEKSYEDIDSVCKKLNLDILDAMFNEINDNLWLDKFYKIYDVHLKDKLVEQECIVDDIENAIKNIHIFNS